jgi:hypothetical protein
VLGYRDVGYGVGFDDVIVLILVVHDADSKQKQKQKGSRICEGEKQGR